MTLLKFKAKGGSKRLNLKFNSLEQQKDKARQARRAKVERLQEVYQSVMNFETGKRKEVQSFEEWLHTPLPADHFQELEDELKRIKEKWAKKYFFNF